MYDDPRFSPLSLSIEPRPTTRHAIVRHAYVQHRRVRDTAQRSGLWRRAWNILSRRTETFCVRLGTALLRWAEERARIRRQQAGAA